MSINSLPPPLFSSAPFKEKRKRDDSSLHLESEKTDPKRSKIEPSILKEPNRQERNPFLPKISIRFDNGSLYEGEAIDGVPHGWGKCSYPDGSSYEGGWMKGFCHGKGKYIYFDGSFYEGQWVNALREGKGKCGFSDGTFYDGEWVRDCRHGMGKRTYRDGSFYEGEWNGNHRHGRGKITFSESEFYEGEWANNLKHGRGKYFFSDQEYYDGEWVNGLIHGQGKYVYDEEEYFEGEWIHNVKQGRGRQIYPNGDSYEGEWKNNRMITNIKSLSDNLFFDLLCGSHLISPPDGYCLGILQDYFEKKGHQNIANSLKEALRCSFLTSEGAEIESHVIYDALHHHQSRLLCYGTLDHEMGLQLEGGVIPGFILCKLYNSGEGLEEFHEKNPLDPDQYKLRFEVKVPLESLTPLVIKTLILSQQETEDIEIAYGHILKLSGAQILPSDSLPWKTQQKGKDCSLQWINKVYLESELPPGQGKQIRQLMKQDCKEANMAKKRVILEIES